MNRILIVNPEKCDGCGECVPACQGAHVSTSGSSVPCLRIVSFPDERVWLPLACQHCEEPSCALTCPTGALTRDRNMPAVLLDHDRCVGCGMCLVSCPFGAIRLNVDTHKAAKCDLCEGDPACVKVCQTGALLFSEPHTLGRARRRRAGAMIGHTIGGWR